MRILKRALSLAIALIILLSFTGCQTPEAEAQFPVGARMSFDNGLVGKDGLYYNDELFYFNELRVEAADPHVIFVSRDDIEDSYEKQTKSYKFLATDGSYKWVEGWSEERFVSVFGSLSDWVRDYSDKFFMTCSRGFTPSDEAAEKFDCTYAAFRIFESTDLSDWKMVGAIEGAGLAANFNTEWWNDHQWAPEFYRDPATGLYFLFYSMSAKWGTENGLIPNVFNANDTTLVNMQLSCAVSATPVGPYELITSEEYYSLRAAKNESGEVIVGDELLDSPDFNGDGRADDRYREIYDRDGESVIGYRSDDGRFFTRYGYEITKNSPPFNFGYYYPRLVSDSALASEFIRQTHVTTFEGFGESKVDNCVFTAIDAHMYNDPVSGDTYMYFSRTNDNDRKYYYVGSLWGVKMLDPITPDYDTLTPLVYPSKSTVYHEEGNPFGRLGEDGEPEGSVNEGPAMLYHNGKYYMTYSPWGAASDDYSVMVAVSDSPLGEFVKPGKEYTPVVGRGDEYNDYMAGTGHHCFITVGEETFAFYHAQKCASNNNDFVTGGFMERAVGYDRITFKYIPELGYDMMFGNGPSYNLQPLPEGVSGYENVARKAKISGNGNFGEPEYLIDGLVTAHPTSRMFEYGVSSGALDITLSWDKPIKIRAIMIYNSGDIGYAFSKVDCVQFKFHEKPVWYSLSEYNGYAYIENILADPRDALTSVDVMRKASSAVAEFDEITVSEIKIRIAATEENNVSGWQSAIRASEIYIFGQEVNA